MHRKPVTTVTKYEKQANDCQNNPFLTLPRDCHLHVFSFLTQRRAARLREVKEEIKEENKVKPEMVTEDKTSKSDSKSYSCCYYL